jgi:hypothetical protein
MAAIQERDPGGAPDVADLVSEATDLERRLRGGEDKIRAARGAGQIVTARRLERHWIGLLEQYERICDDIHSVRGGPNLTGEHASR